MDCIGWRVAPRTSRTRELHEPGCQRAGWQHEAASRVERHFRAKHILLHLTHTRRAMLRQSSRWHPVLSGTVVFLDSVGTSPLQGLASAPPLLAFAPVQTQLPLWPSPRRLWHHRAARSRSGVLGRRGFSLESAVARVCREAGEAVATNLLVRDMDLGVPNAHDSRGGGGRRSATLPRCAVGSGHHFSCLRCGKMANHSEGHQTETRGSQSCSEKEGDHILQACASRQSSTLGGFGPGGWRQVVSGSQDLRAVVGASTGEVGATSDTSAHGAGVALALVLVVLLHHCWNSVEVTGPMGKCRPPTSGARATPRRVVWLMRNFVARVRDVSVHRLFLPSRQKKERGTFTQRGSLDNIQRWRDCPHSWSKLHKSGSTNRLCRCHPPMRTW